MSLLEIYPKASAIITCIENNFDKNMQLKCNSTQRKALRMICKILGTVCLNRNNNNGDTACAQSRDYAVYTCTG